MPAHWYVKGRQKPRFVERNAAIMAERDAGAKLSVLAEKYKLSRSYISLICDIETRRRERRLEFQVRIDRWTGVEIPDDTRLGELPIYSYVTWHLPEGACAGDIRRMPDKELLRLPNIGKKRLAELRKWLPYKEGK